MPYKTSSDTRADRDGSKRYSVANSPFGERDVKSRTIGEIVMQSLFALDHVAYVRFASVYQDFQDVEAFRRQIEQMQQREH